jgi:hypothetical protein
MLCRERVWDVGVDLGQALESEPGADGYLSPCAETGRRSIGIEMLQTKYPWVCSTDMTLFLLGFEATEWQSV